MVGFSEALVTNRVRRGLNWLRIRARRHYEAGIKCHWLQTTVASLTPFSTVRRQILANRLYACISWLAVLRLYRWFWCYEVTIKTKICTLSNIVPAFSLLIKVPGYCFGKPVSYCHSRVYFTSILLCTWNTALLVKLTVVQQVKKLYALLIQRFVSVFTRTRHWSLNWASWIHSAASHRISLRFGALLEKLIVAHPSRNTCLLRSSGFHYCLQNNPSLIRILTVINAVRLTELFWPMYCI